MPKEMSMPKERARSRDISMSNKMSMSNHSGHLYMQTNGTRWPGFTTEGGGR